MEVALWVGVLDVQSGVQVASLPELAALVDIQVKEGGLLPRVECCRVNLMLDTWLLRWLRNSDNCSTPLRLWMLLGWCGQFSAGLPLYLPLGDGQVQGLHIQ